MCGTLMLTRRHSWRSLRRWRRSLATTIRASGSWCVHLVHSGGRKSHGRCADARDGINLTVEHRLREAVPWCRHWGHLCPAVAFRIIELIGAENSAQFIDPAFAADCVNFVVEGYNRETAARGRHRRARRPGTGRDVVNL